MQPQPKPYSNPEEFSCQEKWALKLKGETEVQTEVGFADLVTKTHCYEVKAARKWKQAIGQSLTYSFYLGKKPGLILYNSKSQLNGRTYYILEVCKHFGIKLIFDS